MEKCPNQEEIDHHVQTGILIEHIDTSYLFKDKGIRKSIKKFAEAYGQAKTPNKFLTLILRSIKPVLVELDL